MPKTHVLQLLDEEEYPEVICQRIFPDPFVSEFVQRFGLQDKNYFREMTQEVLVSAFNAYIGGVLDLESRRSEKEDNRVFEKVYNRCRQLEEAVREISHSPTAKRKFIASVQHYDRFEEGSTPRILLDWSKKGHNGLTRLLFDLLVDVEIAAGNSQNKKPIRKEVTPPEERGELWYDSSETDEEFANRVQDWKERSQTNKIPKDHALLLLLERFKPFWSKFSSHPFTEGMHFEEVGGTVSTCVDAVEMIVSRIDPSVERRTIVTAVKKLKHSSYQHDS